LPSCCFVCFWRRRLNWPCYPRQNRRRRLSPGLNWRKYQYRRPFFHPRPLQHGHWPRRSLFRHNETRRGIMCVLLMLWALGVTAGLLGIARQWWLARRLIPKKPDFKPRTDRVRPRFALRPFWNPIFAASANGRRAWHSIVVRFAASGDSGAAVVSP